MFQQNITKTFLRPWQDSNLQSSDPKSDALSIRPHGLVWYCVFEIGTKTKFIRLRIDGYTRTLLFRIYRNGTTSSDVLRHHYQNDFIIEQKWKELINFSTFIICLAFLSITVWTKNVMPTTLIVFQMHFKCIMISVN